MEKRGQQKPALGEGIGEKHFVLWREDADPAPTLEKLVVLSGGIRVGSTRSSTKPNQICALSGLGQVWTSAEKIPNPVDCCGVLFPMEVMVRFEFKSGSSKSTGRSRFNLVSQKQKIEPNRPGRSIHYGTTKIQAHA